ncbi:MAG: flagellar biosynthesis anti-sigma factor FlgM [Lachnospiraceae bacterium]|nr:flagellar biosynthesis anti-sigma factor FlgM [Lachnospiraceae bacterium]
MRIEAYTQVQQLYSTKKTTKAHKQAANGISDQLQISRFGKDIQTAKAAVAASSDVRENLIAPLKESIANGTYQVSGESFAEKLLQQYEEKSNQ